LEVENKGEGKVEGEVKIFIEQGVLNNYEWNGQEWKLLGRFQEDKEDSVNN